MSCICCIIIIPVLTCNVAILASSFVKSATLTQLVAFQRNIFLLVIDVTLVIDANETQTIQPFNPIFSAFSKSILVDQKNAMLTGDNNSTIDMTGGTGIKPELFSVTLILQDIKG